MVPVVLGYTFLKPGSHQIHVMVKNLTACSIMANQGSKIAEMALHTSTAKNEFFNLSKMYTGEELQIMPIGNVMITTTTKNVPKVMTKNRVRYSFFYTSLVSSISKSIQRKLQPSWSTLYSLLKMHDNVHSFTAGIFFIC